MTASAAPASPPAPTASPEQIASLRADLEASGWGVESTRHLLGPVADDALRRELRFPAVRALRAVLAEDRAAGANPSPAAVLTALFMLGEPVPAEELDAVLRRTRTAGALAMGLVVPVGRDESPDADAVDTAPEPGSAPTRASSADAGSATTGSPAPAVVRAAVDLRPHEAHDRDGDVRWWVASDLGELTTGRELAPDHVLGIGGAGLTLASLTPRDPVATALDLGCGCGIQALHLLRHADRVTATDISERALAFTAFNAALAGTDPDRLELIRGSFLEPLAGRAFDLIASNPPFVLTPSSVREAGLPLMEYRDAGAPLLPVLVPAVGEHLSPGGTAVMLGNWEHHRGRDWREQVRAWLPDDLDAWVIQRERQDPVEYAAMWLRDGGVSPERDETAFNARLGSWIDDFAARDIEGIGLGYLILHRPASDDGRREPWRILEEVGAAPSGPLGEHVAQVVAVRSRLAAMSDDEVAALHPVVAPDVTQERHLRPGASDPTLILIRQGGGWCATPGCTSRAPHSHPPGRGIRPRGARRHSARGTGGRRRWRAERGPDRECGVGADGTAGRRRRGAAGRPRGGRTGAGGRRLPDAPVTRPTSHGFVLGRLDHSDSSPAGPVGGRHAARARRHAGDRGPRRGAPDCSKVVVDGPVWRTSYSIGRGVPPTLPGSAPTICRWHLSVYALVLPPSACACAERCSRRSAWERSSACGESSCSLTGGRCWRRPP